MQCREVCEQFPAFLCMMSPFLHRVSAKIRVSVLCSAGLGKTSFWIRLSGQFSNNIRSFYWKSPSIKCQKRYKMLVSAEYIFFRIFLFWNIFCVAIFPGVAGTASTLPRAAAMTALQCLLLASAGRSVGLCQTLVGCCSQWRRRCDGRRVGRMSPL